MNEQSIRFRLGIFVLATLILLAVLITLFGGFPAYFKHADNYTILFDNAHGVAPGTPVRRSGVRIGEVRKVKLDDETGKVEVVVQIDESFTIRKSDRPKLVQGFIGGETAISFVVDEQLAKDRSIVPPGSVLVGTGETNIQTLVQKTGELMPPAQEAMVEVKKVFEKLDRVMPLLEDTLKEFRELGRSTKDLVPELRKTNDEVRELAKAGRASVPDLKKTNEEIQVTVRQWGKVGERMDLMLQTNEDKLTKTLDRVQDALKRVGDLLSDENQKSIRDTLRNVQKGSERLDGIAKNTEDLIKGGQDTVKRLNEVLKQTDDVLANMEKATKPLADRSPAILKNIEESTDKLNRTITDMREVFQAIARGEGSIQKLLSDPSLYNNVNDSAAMVTKILPRLDRILRDVEIFADKIARHPESLGIGGVVRPGSGLKESPSVYPWRLGH